MSQEGAGQSRGRSWAWTTKHDLHLPVGEIRLDWIFLKISKVFMETVAALIVKAVAVITGAVVVMEIRGGPSVLDMNNIGAALSSKSGLPAGRGH